MNETLLQLAKAYVQKHQLVIDERWKLGDGVHGIVLVTKGKDGKGKTAQKIHRNRDSFQRECQAYEIFHSLAIEEILGFNVPHLLNFDEEFRVIEMSIVRPPFLLDFAGAYLGNPPDFPAEVWEQWESEKREQFEERWPKVKAVLRELEKLNIHLIDVTPSNIRFF